MRKLTIIVPERLLRRARRVSKTGITPTVRKSLELFAAHDAYEQLLKMRGKGGFSMSWQELRGDE